MATVQEQMVAAGGWNYIGGCGINLAHPVSGNSTPLTVKRITDFLFYNVFVDIDEVLYFRDGDILSFLASQAFTLEMPGRSVACVEGWNNEIAWVQSGTPESLKASFAVNPSSTILLGNAVTFINQSSGSPDSQNWDFGDGNTSTDENPTHTYTEAGIYTIVLEITKAGVTDTCVIQYIVTTTVPEPIPDPTPDPDPIPGIGIDMSEMMNLMMTMMIMVMMMKMMSGAMIGAPPPPEKQYDDYEEERQPYYY